MKHRAMARLATIVATFALTGQAAPPTDPVQAASDALRDGRYLEGVNGLAAAAFGPDGKVRDDDVFQMWSQAGPMVTSELPVDVFTRQSDAPPDAGWGVLIDRASARDAVKEIVRRAKLTSIVILNEAHYSPRDRAFALTVAKALRPLGYGILAVETFDSSARRTGSATTQLASDGFVRRNTGYYTQDPVFAGFVREALRLGYRPIAYEQTQEQRGDGPPDIARREQAQADNLMARIFTAQPTAKVLIYVGHGHVAEAPVKRSNGELGMWMAARLKRATGVDPLTIDQTTPTDLSPQARAAYPIAAVKVGRKPGVLFSGDQPLVLGQYTGAVDLQVVHPARSYRHGRPMWLKALGGRPVTIPKALLPVQGERLIQAFAADAPADAVSLDQVLVTAGKPAPSLMLTRVKVRFETQP